MRKYPGKMIAALLALTMALTVTPASVNASEISDNPDQIEAVEDQNSVITDQGQEGNEAGQADDTSVTPEAGAENVGSQENTGEISEATPGDSDSQEAEAGSDVGESGDEASSNDPAASDDTPDEEEDDTEESAAVTVEIPVVTSIYNCRRGVKMTWSGELPEGYSFCVYRKTEDTDWTLLSGVQQSVYWEYSDRKVHRTPSVRSAGEGTWYLIDYYPENSGVTYFYDIRICDSDGNQVTENESCMTSTFYLAAPYILHQSTGLGVKNTRTGTRLNWYAVAGAEKYRVYRRVITYKDNEHSAVTGDTGWQILGDTENTAYLVTDNVTSDGRKVWYCKSVYYTIRAIGHGYSSSYYENTAWSMIFVAPPNVTMTNTAEGIYFHWKKDKTTIAVICERKADQAGAGWERIFCSHYDSYPTYTKVEPGDIYYYAFSAYDGNAVSAYCPAVKIQYLAPPDVKAAKSGSSIRVTWTKDDYADGYYLYRRVNSGKWVRILNITDGSQTSYTDTNVKKGNTYCYTVRSFSNVSSRSFSAYKAGNNVKY